MHDERFGKQLELGVDFGLGFLLATGTFVLVLLVKSRGSEELDYALFEAHSFGVRLAYKRSFVDEVGVNLLKLRPLSVVVGHLDTHIQR